MGAGKGKQRRAQAGTLSRPAMGSLGSVARQLRGKIAPIEWKVRVKYVREREGTNGGSIISVEEQRYTVKAPRGELDSVRPELLRQVQKKLDEAPLHVAQTLATLMGVDPNEVGPLPSFKLHSPEIIEGEPLKHLVKVMRPDGTVQVVHPDARLFGDYTSEIDKQVADGTLKVRQATQEELEELERKIQRRNGTYEE